MLPSIAAHLRPLPFQVASPAQPAPPQQAVANLPAELLLQIFAELEVTDLSEAAGTCKAWRRLSRAPQLPLRRQQLLERRHRAHKGQQRNGRGRDGGGAGGHYRALMRHFRAVGEATFLRDCDAIFAGAYFNDPRHQPFARGLFVGLKQVLLQRIPAFLPVLAAGALPKQQAALRATVRRVHAAVMVLRLPAAQKGGAEALQGAMRFATALSGRHNGLNFREHLLSVTPTLQQTAPGISAMGLTMTPSVHAAWLHLQTLPAWQDYAELGARHARHCLSGVAPDADDATLEDALVAILAKRLRPQDVASLGVLSEAEAKGYVNTFVTLTARLLANYRGEDEGKLLPSTTP